MPVMRETKVGSLRDKGKPFDWPISSVGMNKDPRLAVEEATGSLHGQILHLGGYSDERYDYTVNKVGVPSTTMTFKIFDDFVWVFTMSVMVSGYKKKKPVQIPIENVENTLHIWNTEETFAEAELSLAM